MEIMLRVITRSEFRRSVAHDTRGCDVHTCGGEGCKHREIDLRKGDIGYLRRLESFPQKFTGSAATARTYVYDLRLIDLYNSEHEQIHKGA